MARKTLKERLLSSARENAAGCWEWTKAVGSAGYGNLFVDGKSAKAHRVAYEVFNGPIVKIDGADARGTCVMHICDNPKCINPAHLILGTHQDNMKDKMQKGRVVTNPLLGEKHQNAKLCADDVRLIRCLNYVGAGLQQIADTFSVNRATVRSVLTGATWAHI